MTHIFRRLLPLGMRLSGSFTGKMMNARAFSTLPNSIAVCRFAMGVSRTQDSKENRQIHHDLTAKLGYIRSHLALFGYWLAPHTHWSFLYLLETIQQHQQLSSYMHISISSVSELSRNYRIETIYRGRFGLNWFKSGSSHSSFGVNVTNVHWTGLNAHWKCSVKIRPLWQV